MTATSRFALVDCNSFYVSCERVFRPELEGVPKTVNNQKTDPLIEEVKGVLSRQGWIRDFAIRLREEGHIYLGEDFVIPSRQENLTQLIEETDREVEKLDWRVQEFIIMPFKKLPDKEKASELKVPTGYWHGFSGCAGKAATATGNPWHRRDLENLARALLSSVIHECKVF